jgi:hypothetical protein
MNIDQRLEFLAKSTESLHDSVNELHAIVREHSQQLKIDAENIRSLARVAEIHEHRLKDLEGGTPPHGSH